jgi:hypothetical protein
MVVIKTSVLIQFSFGLFYFFENYEFKEDDSVWDIATCTLVEVNRHFRQHLRL